MKDNRIEPLVLTSEGQVKNELKRFIVYLAVWLLGIIVFICLGLVKKFIILYGVFFIFVILDFVNYIKKKKSITEREEYLRIDENGVKVNCNKVQEFIQWKSVESIAFYSSLKNTIFYHIAIVYKEYGKLMVIRIELQDYVEVVSRRKWKKAIIHFSGREDIVDNKRAELWLVKNDSY